PASKFAVPCPGGRAEEAGARSSYSGFLRTVAAAADDLGGVDGAGTPDDRQSDAAARSALRRWTYVGPVHVRNDDFYSRVPAQFSQRQADGAFDGSEHRQRRRF